MPMMLLGAITSDGGTARRYPRWCHLPAPTPEEDDDDDEEEKRRDSGGGSIDPDDDEGGSGDDEDDEDEDTLWSIASNRSVI